MGFNYEQFIDPESLLQQLQRDYTGVTIKITYLHSGNLFELIGMLHKYPTFDQAKAWVYAMIMHMVDSQLVSIPDNVNLDDIYQNQVFTYNRAWRKPG